jgi:hypothetical protein
MKTLIHKIWIITIIIFTFSNCYSQWRESLIDYFGSFKPCISFTSSDTGYLAGILSPHYSVYYMTTDSGLNWSQMDTTNNFFVKDMECKFGFNLSCGTYNENAAIETWNNELTDRKLFQFSDYKEISEINIVDPDNAVFSGMNAESNYVIGLLTKVPDTIEITTLKTFGTDPIDKIKFFSADQGFFSTVQALFYVNDFNGPMQVLSNGILDFDFYTPDTGIVVKKATTYGVDIYKTYSHGNTWEYTTNVEIPYHYVGAIMNSPNTVYVVECWISSSGSDACFHYVTLDNNLVDYIFGGILWCSPPGPMNLYFYLKDHGYLVTNCGRMFLILNNSKFTSIESNTFINTPFNIYPNPSNNQLNIDIGNAQNNNEKTISIINFQGQVIKSQLVFFQQNHTSIDISDLENGLYLLQVTEENRRYNKSFVKL